MRRRVFAVAAIALLAASVGAGVLPSQAQPPSRTLVRESFVDYPQEHPGAPARPPNAGKGSACTLPSSDLCTDFKDGRFRWTTTPVPYYVNQTAAPVGARAAVQAGFAAWEQETKSAPVAVAYGNDASSITYEYEGSSDAQGASLDGENVVSFADLSASCSNCLAVTTYWYWLGTKTLAEFDITFNTFHPWTTSGAGAAYDVQAVTTHEAGHTLVLGDLYKSQDAELTMFGYASLGEVKKRDLGAGDVLGVRKAYPAAN